ncbi:MAG: glycosyltransferase [Dehalococcoidia bacterium]|nr:MAG: glycosyltransferase [Dehalococcoidia bacterium]
MGTIDVDSVPFDGYESLIEADTRQEILSVAQSLKGLRVVHANATPTGGGVAEILRSLVPMMRGLGIDASWWALEADDGFFTVTKRLHNGLQGKGTSLCRKDIECYWLHNERAASAIETAFGFADILVAHDPQVMAVPAFLRDGTRSVWHCHIDLTAPAKDVQARLLPLTQYYARCLVSMPEYAAVGLPPERTVAFPPAIDPFTAKNRHLPLSEARARLAALGIDCQRPLVTQVSRFDPWKDPWGVVDAYRLAKRRVPDLQLALVGALTAKDDPEGGEVWRSVRSYASDEPDIHIYHQPEVGGDETTVNAFQTASNVVVQKSVREGFGLTVTEAMWKGKPVVGGDCGGIRLQIEDGVNGYLVNNAVECAERIVDLLDDPQRARAMGAAARESVRRRFLMPRLLLDYLRLFQQIVHGQLCQPERCRDSEAKALAAMLAVLPDSEAAEHGQRTPRSRGKVRRSKRAPARVA